MSSMAIPVSEVMMPMRLGKKGSGLLWASSKRPSDSSSLLTLLNSAISAPSPLASTLLTLRE